MQCAVWLQYNPNYTMFIIIRFISNFGTIIGETSQMICYIVLRDIILKKPCIKIKVKMYRWAYLRNSILLLQLDLGFLCVFPLQIILLTTTLFQVFCTRVEYSLVVLSRIAYIYNNHSKCYYDIGKYFCQ